MAIVVFNPTLFKARYPVFASIDNSLLGMYFSEAGLYLANTDVSIVQDIPTRTALLNMITAHIASLNGAVAVDNAVTPVGRISQATEGSVSASLEYNVPGSASWFAQTQYGAAFWQATSNIRGFQYMARPTIWN